MKLAAMIIDSTLVSFSSASCLGLITQHQSDPSYLDARYYGISPLKAAINANRIDLVLLLLHHGADPRHIDRLLSRLFRMSIGGCYRQISNVCEGVQAVGNNAHYFTKQFRQQLLAEWQAEYDGLYPERTTPDKRFAATCLRAFEHQLPLERSYLKHSSLFRPSLSELYDCAVTQTQSTSGLSLCAAVLPTTASRLALQAKNLRRRSLLERVHEHDEEDAKFEEQLTLLGAHYTGKFAALNQQLRTESLMLLFKAVKAAYDRVSESLSFQAMLATESKQSHNILVEAICSGYDDLIAQLAEWGFPLSRSHVDRDYVELAIANGCSAHSVSLLLDAIDSLDELYANGATPMHTAVRYNRQDIVSLLLKKDPKVTAKVNKHGQTPLSLAIECHHYEVGYYLCKLDWRLVCVDELLTSLSMQSGRITNTGFLSAYLKTLIEKNEYDQVKDVIMKYRTRLEQTVNEQVGYDYHAALLQLFANKSLLLPTIIKHNALPLLDYIEEIGCADALIAGAHLSVIEQLNHAEREDDCHSVRLQLDDKGIKTYRKIFEIGCRYLRKLSDTTEYIHWLAKFCDVEDFQDQFKAEFFAQDFLIREHIQADEADCDNASLRMTQLRSELLARDLPLFDEVEARERKSALALDTNFELYCSYRVAYEDNRTYPLMASSSRKVKDAINRFESAQTTETIPVAAAVFTAHRHRTHKQHHPLRTLCQKALSHLPHHHSPRLFNRHRRVCPATSAGAMSRQNSDSSLMPMQVLRG